MHEYIVKQSSGKRFLAGLLDFVFVLLLSLLISWPLDLILAPLNYGYNNTYKMERDATLLYSELYEGDIATGQIAVIGEAEKYPKALYHFYVDKRHPETNALQRGYSPILDPAKDANTSFNDVEDYYIFILGKGKETTLFSFTTIDAERPWDVPAKSGQEQAAGTFYEEEFEKALMHLASHERFSYLTSRVLAISTGKVIGVYLFAAAILVLIVPLFLRNSVTLGKLVTKTTLSDQNGFKLKKARGFYRNLAMFIFSYGFFFLPFHVISLMLSIFSKSKQSLFDYLGGTIVVDDKSSLVFTSENDLFAYRKKLARILIDQDRQKRKRLEREKKGA